MPVDFRGFQIDPAVEAERIIEIIRKTVLVDFKRRGALIGVSGGVDSATVLALAVRALGTEKVVALMMPEKDSSPETEPLARKVCIHFGVQPICEDLTTGLTALGCYRRRDASAREVFPDYDPERDRIKIVLPTDLLHRESLNVFSLVLERPGEEERRRMIPLSAYLGIVAASNMKQRTRMLMLYYHAEKRNYAVIGTANKNEHDQGFFVKFGDGGVDIQPIQHLFKTQVYQLARYLDVPQDVIDRTPTTDTYSAGSSQEEFYFRVPFEVLDRIWYGFENNIPVAQIANELKLTEAQVMRVISDLTQKKRTTEYLRTSPLVLSPLLSPPD